MHYREINKLFYLERCQNHCFYFWFFLVFYHFQKNWGCLLFKKNWGRLPFWKINKIVFQFKTGSSCFKRQLRLYYIFKQNWGHLSFLKELRLSSIFNNIEVVFHISSSWVEIRMYTKNQLPRLPETAWIVMGPSVVVWCGGFLADYNTTPTKLFCFVLCCW